MHSSHTYCPASQAHWEHAPLSWMPEDWSYCVVPGLSCPICVGLNIWYCACHTSLGASEASLARGRGKESLQRSLINFHFRPGNPGTPQSVKTITANVPQIRKVTTGCQVSLDSRGRVELFIYKSLSQQHQGNAVSYTHLRAHETDSYLVCRLLLEKKNQFSCLSQNNLWKD